MLDKKTIIDAVGTVGVIASLIFVGVQVQQGAAATRSATVLQLKDAWVQLNLVTATSPDLSRAFETIENEGWEANRQARDLVSGFFRTMFHNWSNAYYQYRNGTLEEDQWLPHLREIKSSINNPIERAVWADWNHVYDDRFRELVNELIVD